MATHSSTFMMSSADTESVSSKNDSAEKAIKPRKFAFLNAKALLMRLSSPRSNTVYEHLVQLVKKALTSEDGPLLETLEIEGTKIKHYWHPDYGRELKEAEEPSESLKNAELLRPFYKLIKPSGDAITSKKIPDLMRIFAAYEEAGIGLPKEEVLTLALSVRNFTLKSSSTNIRFWGKIYGTNKNYYVIEAEETIQKDQPLKITTDLLDTDMKKEEEDLGTLDLDPLPKPDWKPPPTILPEESGKGLNKKVYYVCNLIGEPWIQLPDVTPAQITSSRVIRYLFTGDLEAEMDTYPPFPGVEKNYLRAQIARISGSTVISPINFYQFDEDEEEAVEEDAFRESFVENPEYEPVSIFELIDAGLANWVHHTAYILPQGRTIWWNPSSATRGEGASGRSEEEDEEEELEDEPEPETGPPLLTPLSEDAEVQGQPPWSTRITSHLIPLYAYAVLSSNLWPGAHAIASGRFFSNIYIGWGQKFLGVNFSPQSMEPVMTEFPSGPEISEIEDPTPEEEAAWRAAQAEAAQRAADEDEDQEEEEEEEEGSDEDD